MPANGQAASGSFLKSWFATPSGAENNDVFSSENVDLQGNVISGGPAPRDTNTAKSKTTSTNATATSLIDGYGSATEKNILHEYRSWTYNFTLGALSKASLDNPSLLASDIKKYTVLDSAGKGTKGVSSPKGPSKTVLADANLTSGGVVSDEDADIAYAAQQKIIGLAGDSNLVATYNKESPGRFDLFIDNVKIQTIAAAGSPQSGPAVATNITFDVFEPYSMSGFIEALQVTAKAAGWTDYITGVYALRIQFQGYPNSDSVDVAPKIVPNSTRYFIIKFTRVNIDVHESGTRYQVEAVPQNQLGLGMSNILTADIKVEGHSVGEVLRNFADAINKMSIDEAASRKVHKKHNTYEIAAPKLSTPTSPQNVKSALLKGSKSFNNPAYNDLVNATMNDELKSPNIFKPATPGEFKNGGYIGTRTYGPDAASATTATTTVTKADPNATLNRSKQVVVFSAGSLIHECIAAVVRESDYTRNLFKDKLKEAKNSNKMLTYFNIRMENDNLEFDEDDNKYCQNYRYILEPFQVHFTQVPGQEQGDHDVGPIKAKIKRKYNYIYAGNNEDVTKFNLNFNNLYFSAVPAKGGNPSSENPITAASSPDNNTEIKQDSSNAGSKAKGASSLATNSIGAAPGSPQGTADTTAGQQLGDPYALMAKAFHEKVMGNADMIQGTLEILGDPYFLTVGAWVDRTCVMCT